MVVGIIGYGRFGKLLGEILAPDFTVRTIDKNQSLEPIKACQSIFLCVPIRELDSTLKALQPYLSDNCVVLDTCSVKCYPVKTMQQLLGPNTTIIATHPLFGPDSFHEDTNNRMMMHPVQQADEAYPFWCDYFASKAIQIIEMTPEQHDRFAARSQGITHLLGRTLQHMGIEATPIDTLGFQRLLGVMNQTCLDSWELFEDLQRYNPYTASLVTDIEASINELDRRIHEE